MIISIDDSGGPGLKPGKGVTPYFAIAAIYFATDESAEKTKQRIEKLKKELGWNKKREFKFRKANAEIKRKFFEAVKGQDFSISAVLLEKDNLDLSLFYKHPSKLYNTAILRAVQGLGIEFNQAHFYIDGENGDDYRRRAKTYFRQHLPSGAMKELSYVDSAKDPLIQLADMTVGAIRYTLSDKKDADLYFHMIKKHITTLTKTIKNS